MIPPPTRRLRAKTTPPNPDSGGAHAPASASVPGPHSAVALPAERPPDLASAELAFFPSPEPDPFGGEDGLHDGFADFDEP